MINISPEDIAEFALWFFELFKGDERSQKLRKLFDFPHTNPTRYPHPSLALTSALDNIFLPFLPRESEDESMSSQEYQDLQPNLRLCIFYAMMLDSEGSDMLTLLGRESGKEFMSEFLIFLLLHSQYMKELVALSPSQAKVDEGAMNGEAFEVFQKWISDVLKEVPLHRYGG
jgi:hypothetical protein